MKLRTLSAANLFLAFSAVLGGQHVSPPPSAEAIITSAVQAERTGDLQTAEQQFREAVRIAPGNGTARYLLGAHLFAQHKNEGAIAELKQAVDLLPEKDGARLMLAKAYERAGNLLGAIDQFRILRRAEPQNAEYAYQLGRAYQSLAAWCFERMRQLNPRSARVYQVLGESRIIQGQTGLAIQAFQKAAETEPTVSGSHLALAYIYARQGRRKEALEETGRELAIAPESAAALDLKRKLDSSPR